jgi:hypothetical protein
LESLSAPTLPKKSRPRILTTNRPAHPTTTAPAARENLRPKTSFLHRIDRNALAEKTIELQKALGLFCQIEFRERGGTFLNILEHGGALWSARRRKNERQGATTPREEKEEITATDLHG